MPDASGMDSSSSSSTGPTDTYVTVKFTPEPDGDLELKFDGIKGHQEVGHPFFFELEMTSGKLKGDVSQVLGASASISLQQSKDSTDKSYINGIVTRITSEGMMRGANHYRIEIRPWFWLLTQVTDCKIFQNKSAFDIITQLFRDAGFSDFEDKRQNSAGSIVLEYCVQYRETTFDFVTRLMEEFGIYYFFKHEEDKHTLVFADDSNSHETLSDTIPYQFDQTAVHAVEDHIWEWASEYELRSGKYTVQDYNFTTPSLDLASRTVNSETYKYATYEVYEYPGPYKTTDEGQKFADVRMQAIAARGRIFHGASNCRKLHAGWKFKLDKYPDDGLNNKEYLITRSELAVGIAEGMATKDDEGAENIDTYRVQLRAIPGDTHFRLPRKTKWPMIRGPQTAKVVGPSGDEIYTDEYGRIKVKFYWDRSDTQDEQRTCWIRVAQSWAGKGWGSMTIPRVDMEVVVEFLEGNPDRPLVTGVVYNATQTVPYGLPSDKTKTVFKTNSSTGGSGYNELWFDDKAGEEKVSFQAQKDYEKNVLHDEKATIKNNRDHTVSEGNDSTTVSQGNQSVTVSQGNQSVTVSAGNHSLTVSAGKSDVSAATSITLTSGGTTIKVSPSGVEISGPQVQVTADASMTLNGGGSMSLSAGMISIN
jgi:type VI secretion system secreted protein VgrG